MISQVQPRTSSGESAAAYSRRVGKRQFTETVQRRARTRGILVAVIVAIAVIGIAGGVGTMAYMGSVSDKMSLGNSNAKAALTAAKDTKTQYILFAGEHYEPGKSYTGPDVIMLVRLDEGAKQASILSIPPNLQTTFSDGKTHSISDAQTMGGDAALITAVSEFVEVPISHFVKTDAARFPKLVDALGGVEVKVTEEVDDPAAGDVYIPAGTQTLNGQAALTYCRATNFSGGEDQRAKNQTAFATAMLAKLLEKSSGTAAFTLDGIADTVKTDLSASDAMALIDVVRSIPPDHLYSTKVPGYISVNTATGARTFSVSKTSWDVVRQAVVDGKNPSDAIGKAAAVDPKSFTITLKNGSGVTGGAQQVAAILGAGGFQIAEIGNAESFAYDETLVIYKDPAKEAAAETVVNSLGVGRSVQANSFYTFETDVLVMVGKDWKPLN